MRILFFGAGALGTLYAARIGRAGHDVTVLARGARLETLRRDGLVVRRGVRGAWQVFRPDVKETLASERARDLIVVLVRRAQVDEVLARIASESSADVLVMVNDARGYAGWRALLGERLVVGFAGALGAFDDASRLTYDIAPRLLQPTVIGEPDGRRSERVERIAAVLREAGFPTQIRVDMEAWQRAHAAWITPFMLASALASRPGVALGALATRWARAMRESLGAVAALGEPLAPAGLRVVVRAPVFCIGALFRVMLVVPAFRRQLVASGAASVPEGVTLVDDLVALAARTGRTLPALVALRDEVARS